MNRFQTDKSHQANRKSQPQSILSRLLPRPGAGDIIEMAGIEEPAGEDGRNRQDTHRLFIVEYELNKAAQYTTNM